MGQVGVTVKCSVFRSCLRPHLLGLSAKLQVILVFKLLSAGYFGSQADLIQEDLAIFSGVILASNLLFISVNSYLFASVYDNVIHATVVSIS